MRGIIKIGQNSEARVTAVPETTESRENSIRQAMERARTKTLAAQIVQREKARRRAQEKAAAPPPQVDVPERRRRSRAPNSRDVAEWWNQALRLRYGENYLTPTWTRAQQAKAKAIVTEYGAELTRAVVEAVIAQSTDMVSIDTLHAARQRVFHCWQTQGNVPQLVEWVPRTTRSARKSGEVDRTEVRERKKNFDEFEWGDDKP